MKKIVIFNCLMLHVLFINSQNTRTIQIEAANARPLNLSEIAEQVIPIALEKLVRIQNVFLTGEYLFVASISSIVQYDLSGKFIRDIDCGGYVTGNVTGDTVNRELFVPVGNKIKCYDFFGNYKREYSLETSTLYCIFHKGILWVQSYQFQPNKSSINKINKINLSTGEIFTLPFELKYDPFQFENGPLIGMGATGCLSLYNDEVVVSFERDNILYKIQQDKVTPFVRWNISPPAKSDDGFTLSANGFIGEYIFIYYSRSGQRYIYLENIKTAKKYNASNLVDDIFQTNGNCNIKPINQERCFFFARDRSVFTENSTGNIPLKNGPVIFIVRTK